MRTCSQALSMNRQQLCMIFNEQNTMCLIRATTQRESYFTSDSAETPGYLCAIVFIYPICSKIVGGRGSIISRRSCRQPGGAKSKVRWR